MEDETAAEAMSSGELIYRASDPESMRFGETESGVPVLEGRMMPYNEWTEVNSKVEGHFLERFVPGSLAKTMSEQGTRIRALFEHGFDSQLGKQPIASIDEMSDAEDGAHYRATPLDGLPSLLLAGLRRGLYGSSIRYRPIKWDRVRSPKASEHNPEGLPEHTIREASIMEFSVVTFPQYAGATARIRSLTDEMTARQLTVEPARLLEIIEQATKDEPQHSGREETPEDIPVVPQRSRSTQPPHDYLKDTKEEAWLL